MARIRIIDEWLRSPVSTPTRRRAVFVVADSWAEQRVLMRAFAASPDQTHPTIALRERELEIGPAGIDAHGAWGIRADLPVDHSVQELRAQLEEAARRLAGARRSPPRLEDEESAFEKRPTKVWIPEDATGPPPSAGPSPAGTELGRGADASEASGAPGGRRRARQTEELFPEGRLRVEGTPEALAAPAAGPSRRAAACTTGKGRSPSGRRRAEAGETLPWCSVDAGALGRLGPEPGGVGASAGERRPGPDGEALSAVVGRTLPGGFELSASERAVLNALGRRGEVTAEEVAELASTGDGGRWMDAFVERLAEHGLDLVIPGEEPGGARTFALRH